jgi:hypothetical protein
MTTVRTMVRATLDNICTHDWHVGNIGFLEENAEVMKLLDWEKIDRRSQLSHTLTGCIYA